MIEPTPKLKSLRCRAAAMSITLFFKAGSFVVAALVWYLYDLLFGAAALLIAYLIIGIIRAKMRNSVIPLKQQEYPYTDSAIATWYVAKALMCDTTYRSDDH